jgi:ubiquinone/menaquinone biosynthesis C-methylase UbiE
MTIFESARGLELSSVDWLLDHHLAKVQERQRMVDDLGLEPTDVVLDSACGPGFWARMCAEKLQ